MKLVVGRVVITAAEPGSGDRLAPCKKKAQCVDPICDVDRSIIVRVNRIETLGHIGSEKEPAEGIDRVAEIDRAIGVGIGPQEAVHRRLHLGVNTQGDQQRSEKESSLEDCFHRISFRSYWWNQAPSIMRFTRSHCEYCFPRETRDTQRLTFFLMIQSRKPGQRALSSGMIRIYPGT